jgi:4-amino-4-deoxy-L-arabinose transferase-like glycosyltransferase
VIQPGQEPGEDPKPGPLTRVERLAALAIIVTYLTVTLALAFTARPQSDEAVYANPGYNLVHTGKMGTTLYELRSYLPLSTAEHTYIQPPLYFLTTAALFRIAGFGLVRVRFLSIFFGLVCIFSWYVIVRSLTKAAPPALLVAGLISVDYFFLIGASHGRMEMMCIGLGSAGLAAYMHWRRRSPWRAVLWGNTLAALAMLTHPAALGWAAGVMIAISILDRRLLSLKLIVLLAVPYLLVGAAWGSYIAQDPVAFRDQMKATLIVNEQSFDYARLSHSRIVRYLQQEILTRYAAPFGFLPGVTLASRLKTLVLAAYLAGVFGILLVRRLRQRPYIVWFSLYAVAAFLILAEVSPSKFNYYLPHTTVIMAACLGIFLFHLNDVRRWKPILAVGALLAAIQLAGAAYIVRQNEYRRNYLPVINAIKQNTVQGALVMSQGELWFGLCPDRTVLYDYRLGFLSGLRPAAFVMDKVFRDLHERDRKMDPAAYQYAQRIIDRSRPIYRDDYSEVYLTRAETFDSE